MTQLYPSFAVASWLNPGGQPAVALVDCQLIRIRLATLTPPVQATPLTTAEITLPLLLLLLSSLALTAWIGLAVWPRSSISTIPPSA